MANMHGRIYGNNTYYDTYSTFYRTKTIPNLPSSFTVKFENNVQYRATAYIAIDKNGLPYGNPTGEKCLWAGDAASAFRGSGVKKISNLPNNITNLSFAFFNSSIENIIENSFSNNVINVTSCFAHTHNFNTPFTFGKNVTSFTSTFAYSNYNSEIKLLSQNIKSMNYTFDHSNYNQRPYFLENINGNIYFDGTFLDDQKFNHPILLKANLVSGKYMFANCKNFNSVINIPNIIRYNEKDDNDNPIQMFSNCWKMNTPITFFNNYLNNSYNCNGILSDCKEYNQETWFLPAYDLSNGLRNCTNFNQSVYFRQPQWDNGINRNCFLSNFLADASNFNHNIIIPNYCNGAKIGQNSLDFTFANCTKLNSLVDIDKNMNVKILNGTFYNCISFNKIINIPNNCLYLIDTFNNCTNFNIALNIPNTTSDLIGTFYNCISLNVPAPIPSRVINMQRAYTGCSSLTQLNQPLVNTEQGIRNLYQTFKYTNISSEDDIMMSLRMAVDNTTETLYGTNIYSPSYFFLRHSVDGLDYTFGEGAIGNIYNVFRNITILNHTFYNARVLYNNVNYISIPGTVQKMNGTFKEMKLKIPIQLQEGVLELKDTFYNSFATVSLPNTLISVKNNSFSNVPVVCYEGSLSTENWGIPNTQKVQDFCDIIDERMNLTGESYNDAFLWALDKKILTTKDVQTYIYNINSYYNKEEVSYEEAVKTVTNNLDKEDILYDIMKEYNKEFSSNVITQYLNQYTQDSLYNYLSRFMNLSENELRSFGLGKHSWDETTIYTREDLCYEQGGTYIKCKRCGCRKWLSRSGKRGKHLFKNGYCYYCGLPENLEEYFIYTIINGYAVITGIHFDKWDKDFGELSLIEFPEQLRDLSTGIYYPTLIDSK